MTVKVKYADFRQITRSRSNAGGIASQAVMEHLGLDLLRPLFPSPLGIRLLGITVSNLDGVSSLPRGQPELPLAWPE